MSVTSASASVVKQEGNSLYVIPQGMGTMEGAGSGERQLWSMLAAMGPMEPNAAKEWMNGFIPDTRNTNG